MPPPPPSRVGSPSMFTSPSESEGMGRFSPQTSALFSVRHQYCHWIYFRLQIKAFLSELCSLQRHGQHPVRHLVGVQNAKVNSHLSVFFWRPGNVYFCFVFKSTIISPAFYSRALSQVDFRQVLQNMHRCHHQYPSFSSTLVSSQSTHWSPKTSKDNFDLLGFIFTAFPLLIVDSMEQQVSAKYFALRFEGGGSTSLSYISLFFGCWNRSRW